MDLWVVAAATGCGYLSKVWQNIAQERDCTSESPSVSSLAENSNTCDTKNISHIDGTHIGATSSCATEHEIHEDRSISSSSIFPPEFRQHDKSMYREGCKVDFEIPEYPTWETGNLHGSERGGNLCRSTNLHLQLITPPSTLDNCLVAQMEDYLRSPLASPCTQNLRQVFISQSKANGEVVGVPSWPKHGEDNYSREKSVQSDSQVSASGTTPFLSFGFSIGMLFTIIANRLEWNKLKESTKVTENLVRDLQGEMEKKDSLTVKELAIDTYESSCGKREVNMMSKLVDTDALITTDSEEYVSQIESERMRKIEAELEAELERLELSIKGVALRERLSDSVEDLDDDIAELVHGELNAHTIGGKSSSGPTPSRGSSGHSTKQGVSPHELSLRLHEVICSRLQDRITEIEDELLKSQRRVQQLESEKMISWQYISNSESSSSRLGSLTNQAHSPNEAYCELNGLQNGYSNIRVETQQGYGSRDSSNEGSQNGYGSGDDVDDLLLIKQIVEKARQRSPAFLRAQRALVYLDDE